MTIPASLFLAVFAYFVLTFSAEAHSPGMSSAMVTVHEDKVEAIVTFSRSEVEGLLNAGTKPESLADEILTISGQGSSITKVTFDDDNNAIFHFIFPGRPTLPLTICSSVIRQLVPGHRLHLIVRDSSRELILQRLFKVDSSSVTIPSHSIENRPENVFFIRE